MSCDLSSRSQRVMEFQLVSLRQIGESLLKLLDDDLKDDLLYVAGDLSRQSFVPVGSFHTSPHNAGAMQLAEELKTTARGAHCQQERVGSRIPASSIDGRVGDGEALPQPTIVVLLNCTTFSNPAFAIELQSALDAGQRIVLAHDTAVTFEEILSNTPQALIDGGLYNELAVPLYQGEHRKVSAPLQHTTMRVSACLHDLA